MINTIAKAAATAAFAVGMSLSFGSVADAAAGPCNANDSLAGVFTEAQALADDNGNGFVCVHEAQKNRSGTTPSGRTYDDRA